MINEPSYNTTQNSIIGAILNLLVHNIVCDEVRYELKPCTSNGSAGKNATVFVDFIGSDKPKMMIVVKKSGVVTMYEEYTDFKSKFKVIHSYL